MRLIWAQIAVVMSFAFAGVSSGACTLMSTDEALVIDRPDPQNSLDYALGTFWPNRSGNYDLGERVEFFRGQHSGPVAQNLRFKIKSGTLFEYPHLQRLYFQPTPTAVAFPIATRAVLAPVGWRL